MTADILLYTLAAYALIAWIGALIYLSRRPIHWTEYAIWGLTSLLVPVFGPFFVIAAQPGRRVRDRRRTLLRRSKSKR
jgi:hypothetical protein